MGGLAVIATPVTPEPLMKALVRSSVVGVLSCTIIRAARAVGGTGVTVDAHDRGGGRVPVGLVAA